ncbi:MAG: UbiA family prenyltransferase [Actinomycetota bacterium]
MPAQKGFPLFVRVTRIKVLPLTIAPVCVGATLGWERAGGRFCYGWFALVLIGSACMHLGANVLNDVHDEASEADDFARRDQYSVATGSGVLGARVLSKSKMLTLSGLFFAIAAGCGVALAIARGTPVIWFGVAGFALALFYGGKPVRYGYIGHGLGEIGIFAAFGVLPVVGSYYVQTQHADLVAWVAAILPGLLGMNALYSHNFLHFGPDKEARKMTPVAVLGPEAGLLLGRIFVLLFVVAAAILTLVFRVWPPGAAAVTLVAAPIFVAQRSVSQETSLEAYVRMLGAALGACALGDALLVASSIVRVLIR